MQIAFSIAPLHTSLRGVTAAQPAPEIVLGVVVCRGACSAE